jgi:hypothetical protein
MNGIRIYVVEAVLIFPGTVILFEMRVLGAETLLTGLLVGLAFVLAVEHFPLRQVVLVWLLWT